MGQLVREKKFRDDLYFRISTIPLSFPSLRDRKEDIPTLAQYLLTKVSTDLGGPKLAWTMSALEHSKNTRGRGMFESCETS
jgi:transcriptional regulator with GAF, ATPase, and Fis domain